MSLVAQYLFNGNCNDEMGNYNGTPSNITYQQAPSGYRFANKVAVFSGNSKILLPLGSKVTQSWTMDFWCTLDENRVNNLFGCGNSNTDGYRFWGLFNRSHIDFCVWGGDYRCNALLQGEKWHHVAWTYDSNRALKGIYLDGKFLPPYQSDKYTIRVTTPIYFGGVLENDINYVGSVGNVSFYDGVLSTDVVNRHYTDGLPSPSFNLYPRRSRQPGAIATTM